MEDVGISYGHLVYFADLVIFMVIWYRYLLVIWYIFSVLAPRKIWQPCSHREKRNNAASSVIQVLPSAPLGRCHLQKFVIKKFDSCFLFLRSVRTLDCVTAIAFVSGD
jgi:hypothetical protein